MFLPIFPVHQHETVTLKMDAEGFFRTSENVLHCVITKLNISLIINLGTQIKHLQKKSFQDARLLFHFTLNISLQQVKYDHIAKLSVLSRMF